MAKPSNLLGRVVTLEADVMMLACILVFGSKLDRNLEFSERRSLVIFGFPAKALVLELVVCWVVVFGFVLGVD